MDKNIKFLDFIKFPPVVLQLLQDYAETVAVQQQSLLGDVNTYIHSNKITSTNLMNAVIWISLLNDKNESQGNEENTNTRKKPFREIVINLSRFIPLIAETTKNVSDQIELLAGIQMFCTSEPVTILPILPQIVRCLYDFQILSEEAILDWYESELKKQKDKKKENKSAVNDINANILRELKPFVAWLETPDENEDEDE